MVLNNEEIIDKTIEFLKQIKGVRCDVKIDGPNIEEIYGTPDEVYGITKMNIEIQFDDLYKRTQDLFSIWEKVKK